MKQDAFDDLLCPFDYKRELRKVRKALEKKIGEYISNNPNLSYRDLKKGFGLSIGTLCGIARRHERRTKAIHKRHHKRLSGWRSGNVTATQLRRHPTWLLRRKSPSTNREGSRHAQDDPEGGD
jgi:hypothetical protein